MENKHNKIGRRQFLKEASIGLIGAVTAACQPLVAHVTSPEQISTPTFVPPTSTPQPTPIPTTPTPTFSPDQLPFILSQQEIEFLASHEIHEGDTSRSVVMMTYDDNGKYDQVRTILDAYNKYGAKATFFFLGEKITLSSKAVRAVVEEGHLLACHGYEHINLQKLNNDQINRQIEGCFKAVQEVIPGYRLRFIRFPFGNGTNDTRLLKLAATWGLQHVFWSMGSGGLNSATYNTVMRNVGNGAIVLSHMFREYDVSQVERIVGSLIDRGYSLETLETGRKPADVFEDEKKIDMSPKYL
ncbi:MAG: polysaccharide deacetylase family protein [Anaerolineaceae bacterium]